MEISGVNGTTFTGDGTTIASPNGTTYTVTGGGGGGTGETLKLKVRELTDCDSSVAQQTFEADEGFEITAAVYGYVEIDNIKFTIGRTNLISSQSGVKARVAPDAELDSAGEFDEATVGVLVVETPVTE